MDVATGGAVGEPRDFVKTDGGAPEAASPVGQLDVDAGVELARWTPHEK